MAVSPDSDYQQQLNGSFTSLLRWPEFDAMWQQLRQSDCDNWYIYNTQDEVPQQTANAEAFKQQLDELASWLKSGHEEDYCGIVYVDNKSEPSFVKIYDPHNLGVVCGISREPIAPAWTLSKAKPCAFKTPKQKTAGNWWRRWLRIQA